MSGQRGSAPLELALGAGVLLIPAALLVLSFGPWLETRAFTRLAAGEAARAVVLGNGDGSAAALVWRMADGAGIDASRVRLGFCGGAPVSVTRVPVGGCAPLRRGGLVRVVVQVEVPLIRTPFGAVGGLRVQSAHAEPVDLYRSLP